MLVDFILHKANGTDTVELNKSIDGYSVVLNPKLHDVYNQVSYVEFDVAMSMDNYIEIGDWIEVDGKKYYSLTNFASFNARIAKGGTYNVRFYSPEQWLYKANMYATNEIYSGGVYSWERVDNTIVTVGNLESFGRWLCWNTNAQQNTRMFKLGNVPTGMNEQYEVLDFNPANCLSALYSICKTYKVRYEVVPNTEASPDSQYIINFYDTDEVFPVTFKYEEENGLYKLELTGCDEEVYTQFEIAGSTENIPSFYRDTRLRLSESISALSILDYPDLYDKWGRSIKILTYENIKPTRTGTVTDIVVDDIYSFIDSSLIGATWSPVGGTIQVVEGPLMGFSFECDYFNSTNGRVHIKPMTESNGMELPSADLSYYRFTAGATPTRYNVVGIALPNEYIEDAEARLLAAAMNDTSYYSDIRASYSLAISGTLLEEGEYEINAGVLVPIQHLGIGLDRSVRVQSITYDLSKPKYYDIEEIQLSDFRQEGLMDMVTEGVRKSVATLKDVGYTNKLNTFANSVSTIKQGIAKSLGYGSWEDFMEKTWNGEGEEWSANTIIIENLINSDLINVNTLIAREAFVNTLLANELFVSGVQNETESLVNNYLLYLTSSVATVACDYEGTVTGTLPTSTAIVYHGASADTGWSFSGELSGCTGSVNEGTGVITITGLTADDSTVTVSATKADKPTLQSIFRISKVYAGADGADGDDAVYYYLTPSVDAVIRSMDGTATPSTVSCAQYKIQGGGTPVAANKTIKYQRSIDGTMQTYSTAVAVSTSVYIDFYLYDGVTELWRTRVPVLHDLDEWESTLNDFAKGLGYTDTAGGDSAYEKLVGAALAGETIMEGAYLRNSLIDTEHLIAHDAFINRIATNSITIGQIGTTAAALDDAIQVGGRNLLLNSGIVVTNANYNRQNLSLSTPTIIGQTYTFSLRCDDIGDAILDIYDNTTDSTGKLIGRLNRVGISNAFAITFEAVDAFIEIRIRNTGDRTNPISTYECQLEKGNKATDWTPAVEDVQAEIDANASALSDFEGAVTTSISGLQAQIDGVVDSWFYAYTPTTANYPASEWTTAELKQRHVGDTFTNTQAYVDEATTPDAGKSWRWVNNSSVYSWTPIADSDAVKALLAASTAQDTADGKRRVFTTTPTPPYDKDDLWSGGSSGDLKISTTTRAAGSSYVAGDWVLATKYTDDTAVTSLENALGELAYKDMVSAAKLDSTIIEGGYIKTSLINANTIAAGTLIVSAINDSVDAIQVGGRNYYLNTATPLVVIGTGNNNQNIGNGIHNIVNTDLQSNGFVAGDKMVLSYKWRATKTGASFGSGYFRIRLRVGLTSTYVNVGSTQIDVSDSVNSGSVSVPLTLTNNTLQVRFFTPRLYYIPTDVTLIFYDVKIERGNKPTDWTPAPEDVQEDYATKFGYSNYADLVAKATEGSTIISGGYLNTDLIEARSIVAGKIATGTITANEIDVSSLTADSAFISAIATNSITIGQIGTTAAALDDAIQVGGRNLLRNFKAPNWSGLTGSDVIVVSPYEIIRKSPYVKHFSETYVYIEGGDTFTFSGRIGGSLTIYELDSENVRLRTVVSYQNIQKITFTTLPQTVRLNIILSVIYLPEGEYSFSNVKLEKGNKATDWTPAPEDVQEDYATKLGYSSYSDLVTQAEDGLTIIDGGYINTDLIEARSIVAGKIATGTITANEIKAGTITANKIDLSSLTADSAFIESLATESAFIDELTGNTAFISALTVNSLNATDGTLSVSISNSAVNSACGVYLSGSSQTASLAYGSASYLSLQFISNSWASELDSNSLSIFANDPSAYLRLSADLGSGVPWGLRINYNGKSAHLYVDSVPTLSLSGATYDTILNDTSLSIADAGAYLSSSKLKVSNLPSTTQSSGEFWKDSKGHVMVGAASAYTASDVGAVPTTRKVNSKALSANITLSASDVGAVPTTDIQYFTQSAWNALDSAQKAAIKLAIVY